MKTDFSPVYPHFYELFKNEQEKEHAKIFYFGIGSSVEEAQGKIIRLLKNDLSEEFLHFDTGTDVRLDRIITINGKPGPAYDEYDRYGLACLDCSGGMD